MIGSWASVLPPLIAILMVLATRKVLLSLGAGVVSAAFIAASFAPIDTLKNLWEAMTIFVWEDGALNTYTIYIMIFILLLGILTAFVSLSGGSRAFAAWAVQRIKTKRGAKLLTVFLGFAIFVDDYFNSLAVGQIARPITDQHRVSRAKLAYFIDSTSAPICVVSPISSWGAYLVGQLALIFGGTAVITYSPLSAFIMMAPMNFYVITTLSMVFFFAWTNYDLFAMKKHEQLANDTGQLYSMDKEIPGQLKEEFPEHIHGRVRDLVMPIVTLVVVTLGMMIVTGYRESVAAGDTVNIWSIFENTDVPFSLVTGGLIGVVVAVTLYVSQMKMNETASVLWMGRAVVSGLNTMMPAVLILIFAWALTHLIDILETGVFLSNVVKEANVPVTFLPVMLFVLACLMSFATGTSWGSFGILIPIGAQIMIDAAPEFILPALAAILAGSVFGDHCSPISDSTILSSTGAGCNHMDHVLTQLPYAIISASVAALGYLALGFTGSIWIGLVVVILALVLLFTIWAMKASKNETQPSQ